MRRAFALAASVLMLLVAASPAAAATQTFRYSVLGSGAVASGLLYQDGRFEAAFVEMGDQAIRASDGEVFLRYLYVDHLLEVCDGRGCTVEYVSGITENVPFTIDRKKLTSASVDVTVDGTRCVDSGRRVTCSPATIVVRLSWAGYGEIIRTHGTASGGWAGEYQYTLNGATTERWATVTGSIDGFDMGGAPPIASLYTTRYAERTISHG
jgi:hypothetical protein